MAKKFASLRAQLTQSAQIAATEQAADMLTLMSLNELRVTRGFTQSAVAETLGIQQPAVAKIERRKDLHLSTLRKHIQSMGGELDIVARFPDGAIRLEPYSSL
jgi:DNA-binding XRE family transcriptional regulator